MNAATRYACHYCDLTKMVRGQRPLTPKRKIKTGCERCGDQTPHYPVGHPAGTRTARGWAQ